MQHISTGIEPGEIVSQWLDAPRHADSVIADRDGQCSYQQLACVVGDIARLLSARGVQPAHCVTVEVDSDLRGASLMLALLRLGCDVVPLPARGLEARGGSGDIPLPTFSQWRVKAPAAGARAPLGDVTDWLAVEPDAEFSQPADAHALRVAEPGSRWYWRTSGSLGSAKLTVSSIRRTLGGAQGMTDGAGLHEAHRVALPVPIFHKFGFSTLLSCLAAGCSLDLQTRGNLLRFLEREEQFAPDVAFLSPSFCETLNRTRRSPRPYQFSVCGGDCIGESTFRRFEALHGTLRVAYGSSEMGPVSLGGLDMDSTVRATGAAWLLPGMECRISPTATPGMAAHAGELWIRSAVAFDGYVDVEGRILSAADRFEDGWFRSGDLATFNEHGLRVLGRSDFSVNRNGLLLPLADVETRLRELSDIAEAAVTPGGDSARGRAIVAFVVMTRPSREAEQALQDRVREILPAYAQPDSIHVLREIPRLGSGKINRMALTALAQDGAGSAAP